MRTVRGRVLGAGFLWAGLALAASGQASVTLTEPSAPLLPQSFGGWTAAPSATAPAGPVSLTTVNKQALEEDGPQRSQVANYQRGEAVLHLEAVQFGDRTGAYSAYTLVKRAGMRESNTVGSWDSAGDSVVVFQQGTTLVVAYPVELTGAALYRDPANVADLKALAEVLPKVSGNKGVAPLLPTLVPEAGLVNGSVRYALGAASYQAQGGVLPAQSLGWDKSAEAVTAQFADKRGQETLTLLLYPTPMIAGRFTRSIQDAVGAMGPQFATAKVRREGELVMLANGSFAPDVAQKLIENIHMRQELSFDKDVQPVFHTELQKTYSVLSSIGVLAGVLMLAAVLLGLFLGYGRAAIRVMRGKSAAIEPEFLSLHLAPQNETPRFEPPKA